MRNDIILIILEGQKTEPHLLKELFEEIQKETSIKLPTIALAFWKSDLISLYRKIKNDPFLDYIGVLQESPRLLDNPEELLGIQKERISQTFLLFDHDVQCVPSRYDNKIERYTKNVKFLLDHCDNETSESGKLLINYPMIESFWDHPESPNACSIKCPYPTSENKRYKEHISKLNSKRSRPVRFDYALSVCNTHLQRARNMTDGETDSFDALETSQRHIFDKEIDLITRCNKSMPLNPVVFLLLDLFGKEIWPFIKSAHPLCPLDCFPRLWPEVD